MGAEAIKDLLAGAGSGRAVHAACTQSLRRPSGQKKLRIIKRLEVVEAFRQSGNKPSSGWFWT